MRFAGEKTIIALKNIEYELLLEGTTRVQLQEKKFRVKIPSDFREAYSKILNYVDDVVDRNFRILFGLPDKFDERKRHGNREF